MPATQSQPHPLSDLRAALGDDAYLNTAEAAQVLGVTIHALRRWRQLNVGPKYSHPHGMHPRYRLGDIKDYLASETVDPTKGAA